MSRNKKILIGLAILASLGAIAFANTIAPTITTTPTPIRIFLLRLMRLHDS